MNTVSKNTPILILLTGMLLAISCQKELPCEDCEEINHGPIAIAGADQVITLPIDSVLLDGSGSYDPDNNILSYSWAMISGPGSPTMDTSGLRTMVNHLVEGVYLFELTVTDAMGLMAKDSLQVTVLKSTASMGCYTGSCGGYWICLSPVHFQYVLYTGNMRFPGAFGAAAANGSKMFFAGGHEEGDIGFTWSQVCIFNSSDNSWSYTDLSIPRSHLSGASCGNKVLFAGGNNKITANPNPPYGEPPLEYYDVVDFYDAADNSHTVATLSEARAYMAAAGTADKAFFIGGKKLKGYSSKMDIYDFRTNTWSVIDLPRTRAHGSAVVVGNKLIIAGGSNENGNLKTADVYDLSTNSWSTLEVPHEHPVAAMAIAGNKLLVAGGDGLNNKAVDIYDLDGSSWSYAELSDSRYNMAVATANNTVIFMGGNYSCKVDIYKANTGQWLVTQLNDGVNGVAATATATKCGFAGFLYQNGNALTSTFIIIDP